MDIVLHLKISFYSLQSVKVGLLEAVRRHAVLYSLFSLSFDSARTIDKAHYLIKHFGACTNIISVQKVIKSTDASWENQLLYTIIYLYVEIYM